MFPIMVKMLWWHKIIGWLMHGTDSFDDHYQIILMMPYGWKDYYKFCFDIVIKYGINWFNMILI